MGRWRDGGRAWCQMLHTSVECCAAADRKNVRINRRARRHGDQPAPMIVAARRQRTVRKASSARRGDRGAGDEACRAGLRACTIGTNGGDHPWPRITWGTEPGDRAGGRNGHKAIPLTSAGRLSERKDLQGDLASAAQPQKARARHRPICGTIPPAVATMRVLGAPKGHWRTAPATNEREPAHLKDGRRCGEAEEDQQRQGRQICETTATRTSGVDHPRHRRSLREGGTRGQHNRMGRRQRDDIALPIGIEAQTRTVLDEVDDLACRVRRRSARHKSPSGQERQREGRQRAERAAGRRCRGTRWPAALRRRVLPRSFRSRSPQRAVSGTPERQQK